MDAAAWAATRERAEAHTRAQEARAVDIADAASAQDDGCLALIGDERRTRATLARARTHEREGLTRLVEGAAIGSLVTFGAYALLGPVGAVVAALSGLGAITLWEGDTYQ
jgi:hypothetical protein